MNYIVCLFMCLFLSHELVDENKIVEVKIRVTNLMSSTEIAVNCGRFEKAFDDIKECTFKQKSDMIEFVKILNFSKQNSQLDSYDVDVRGIVIFKFLDNTQDTLCFDRLGRFVYKNVVYESLASNYILAAADSIYWSSEK